MNPTYGSYIRSYLFEPLDFGTAARVRESINYCISNFEPRISVVSLQVFPNFNDNGFEL